MLSTSKGCGDDHHELFRPKKKQKQNTTDDDDDTQLEDQLSNLAHQFKSMKQQQVNLSNQITSSNESIHTLNLTIEKLKESLEFTQQEVLHATDKKKALERELMKINSRLAKFKTFIGGIGIEQDGDDKLEENQQIIPAVSQPIVQHDGDGGGIDDEQGQPLEGNKPSTSTSNNSTIVHISDDEMLDEISVRPKCNAGSTSEDQMFVVNDGDISTEINKPILCINYNEIVAPGISKNILMNHIFIHLSFKEIFTIMSIVCKKWYECTTKIPPRDDNILYLNFNHLYNYYNNQHDYKVAFLKMCKTRFTNISGLYIVAFQDFPHVEPISEYLFERLWKFNKNLKQFEIRSFRGTLAELAQKSLLKMKSLTELSIANIAWSSRECIELFKNGKLTHLKKLTITSLLQLERSLCKPNFNDLEYLTISDCPLTDFVYSSTFVNFQKLKYLALNCSSRMKLTKTLPKIPQTVCHLTLTKIYLKQLSLLSHLKNLTTLDITDCKGSKSFFEGLESSFQSLEHLIMPHFGYSLDDDDCTSLSSLKLKTLVLSQRYERDSFFQFHLDEVENIGTGIEKCHGVNCLARPTSVKKAR